MIQLQVRGLFTHTLECGEDETISSIKARAATLMMIAPEQILLYSAGSPLHDDITVCQLTNLDLELTIPLLGGKVHGSLARAGKVKGQTPKVEKQEKRKKKTGRAKRRIQYNRHFVSYVQTFGRRKGPNSRT